MTETEWLASVDPARMLGHLSGSTHREVPHPSARKLRLFAVACCRAVWDWLTDDAPCPNNLCIAGDLAGKVEAWKLAHNCSTCSGTGRLNRSRHAVEVAERYADGEASEDEAWAASDAAEEAYGPMMHNPSICRAAMWACHPYTISQSDWLSMLQTNINADVPPATQASLLREVFGNPFHRQTCQWSGTPRDDTKCKTHGVTLVRKAIGLGYSCPMQGSAFRVEWFTSTVLQLAQAIYDERAFDRMWMLAEALEDAGCTDETLLRHCRGEEECWELDCDDCTILDMGGTVVSVEHWRPLRGPHVRGCWVVDLCLGKS